MRAARVPGIQVPGTKMYGEVSERPKEHAWKACVGVTLPRVRIPPSPPGLRRGAGVVERGGLENR